MNQNTKEPDHHLMEFSKDNLWDEIAKAIINHMPHQIFPLIQETLGKIYPKGTSIQLLQTEYPIPDKKTNTSLTSIYTDMVLLINGTDLYHIECQMKNDKNMAIRIIEYDFYVALRHGSYMEADNIYTLHFPQSVVVYPDINSNLPNNLVCNIIFPDGSSHQYNVPTVKLQDYTLEDIRQKHLTFFLPFKLLSFKPRLDNVTNPIQENELTDYIHQIIVILEEEYKNGNISDYDCKDYLGLINLAAERIFHSYQSLKEEVINVTKSTIVLYSDLRREVEIANLQLADKDAEIANKNAEIADKNAEIANLQAQLKEALNQIKK